MGKGKDDSGAANRRRTNHCVLYYAGWRDADSTGCRSGKSDPDEPKVNDQTEEITSHAAVPERQNPYWHVSDRRYSLCYST